MSADVDQLEGKPDELRLLSIRIDRRTLAQATEIAAFRQMSRAERVRRAIRHAIEREHQGQRDRFGDPREWVAEP